MSVKFAMKAIGFNALILTIKSRSALEVRHVPWSAYKVHIFHKTTHEIHTNLVICFYCPLLQYTALSSPSSSPAGDILKVAVIFMPTNDLLPAGDKRRAGECATGIKEAIVKKIIVMFLPIKIRGRRQSRFYYLRRGITFSCRNRGGGEWSSAIKNIITTM